MAILLISREVWEAVDADGNLLFSEEARAHALGNKKVMFIEDQP